MADNNLKYRATLDASGFEKGANKVAKATAGVSRSTGKSSQSFTQLAYALDDAQIGQVKFSQSIRGMQNNIQALAVSAGVGGPWVLAITAITAAVGAFARKWEKAAEKVEESAEKIGDKIISLQKSLGIATEIDEVTQLISEYKKLRKEKEKELQRLTRKRAVQSGDVFTVGGADEIKKAQDAIRQLEKNFQQDLTRIRQKESSKRNKLAVEAIMKRNKEEQKAALKPRAKIGTLESAITPRKSSLDQLKKWQRQATGLVKNFALAWGIEWKNVGKITTMSGDELNKNIKATQEKLGHTMTTTVKETHELGQALQSALSDAFTGLGQSIGDALAGDGDFGNKFLAILAGFMSTFGAAIIAVGLAALNLEVALSTGQAWLAIGAGVALVAAGAVLSNVASKGVDGTGGGASGVSRSQTTTSTTTPNSVQGASGNQRLVAQVSGQDLRFVLQGANETYSARN